MAVAATGTGRRLRVRVAAGSPWLTAGALAVIVAYSVFVLRDTALGTGYWIDEGLSVGIADRPLSAIPGVLRLDGSPPAYYMLLHVWIALTGGTGPRSTHALSLLIAAAAIPATWALLRVLVGVRAAWIGAVLVAGVPFLTQYAQESRMYALVVLLSLVACACFLGAFALREGSRRWAVAYGVAQVALLYTHNWGLFLGAGLTAAWLALLALAPAGPGRRGLVRQGLLAAATILVLYGPWLPTLAFQAAHTGAPWANPPGFEDLYKAPQRLFGKVGMYVLVLGSAVGLGVLWRGDPRRFGPEGRAALAMVIAAVVGLTVPWLISQSNPAWAYRYTAIAVGPLVLFGALALARSGATGLAALALAVLAWNAMSPAPTAKSNVSSVAADIRPSLAPGDLVISTQPEQVPVLHHDLQGVGELSWATLWGPVGDVGVTDWRDGVTHLRETSPERDLAPLLDRVEPGGRVALVLPITANLARWRAPWTALVRQRSNAWASFMRSDGRFRVVAQTPAVETAQLPNSVKVELWIRKPIP